MPNGAAALHVLDAPASDPETSVAAPTEPGIETQIGQVTADAAMAVAWGVISFQQAGRLDPAAKEAGGTKLARVSMLMLNHDAGDLDFAAKTRAAAKPLLRAHLDAEFFRRHTPEQGDAALDLYIGFVFEIVTRAVAVERALRATSAH